MNPRISRRAFVKFGMAGGAALFLPWTFGPSVIRASSGGPTLDPHSIPKFRTPLLIPPAMPRAGKIKVTGGRNIDYYEIAVRQFEQQILPAGMPSTTVWGYGPRVAMDGAAIFNAPSLTIEATHGTPVRVKWVNELRSNPADPTSPFLPHLLPVDQTLHWANPPGGSAERDSRPVFASTPGSYRGPVPIVTHVHGSAGVGDESDGYAEAWFLPRAGNVPDGYATTGTWYDFFRSKAAGKGLLAPGTSEWEPGTAVFQYPNSQRASTIWYHDHTLGMTRLNVYAGPAGFFLIRGGPGDVVLDRRTGRDAILPGPAPALGDPAGLDYHEIAIAIQDRSFNDDGSLFYPDARAFFDEIAGPFTPETDLSPIWNPEFFGNTIMVNGATWPYLTVEQRRYRFRFLNGCDSRFLILDFAAIPGVQVWQVGNEGGFLPAPLNLTELNGGRLLMALAERADLIVDFSNVPRGSHVLRNIGPDEPYGGGEPDEDFDVAEPSTTGQVMEFRVVRRIGADRSTPPQFLRLPTIHHLGTGAPRRLALVEEMSTEFADAPAAALLGTVEGNPANAMTPTSPLMWSSPITENPEVGDTEVWEFYNTTGDAHPMHVHEVLFEVVNRQPIIVEEESHRVQIEPGSEARAPEPWEAGWKDTVTAYPGEVTRVKMRFEVPGQYTWHCHIVSHEDNEMMRPYRIGPVQAGQPA
ncbi:MAG TPA: multicopper oxidase [Candidatus Polarisedimenticolia bacterium]|nr:multicopper oxidase [Candidatus Polarisedimenticolia bacterium]